MSHRLTTPRTNIRTTSAFVTLATTTALVFGCLSTAAWAKDDKPAASSKKAVVKGTDTDGDGDLDRPDTVSAVSTALALKKRVEDLSKRTETTRTFANANGSFTDEQFGGVVRVQSEDDGSWKDVDYNLEQQADGSWAPKVSPVDVTIDGGSSKEAARVTFEDGQSLAVTWPQALPEPIIEGSIATYKLSDSTDLVVMVTGRGVNTHIRLNSVPTEDDPVFELGLRADDLDVKKSGAGLKIIDGDGEAVGGTSNLVAWDSKTDDSGSPLEVVPLESTLEEEGTSNDVTKHALELKTPEGYLTDPNTQYPVTIDPDIGTLERLRDTYVRSGDVNHYYDNNFAVGKISGETNQGEARAYLKFHTGGQIPGKQILAAEMRLWQYYSGTCAGRPMEIHPVTGAWDGNLTWSSQPAVIGTGALTIYENRGASSSCGDGWTRADVTAMVQGWANGSIANEGIRLAVPIANAGTAAYGRRFCSMDPSGSSVCNTYEHMPFLSVTYNNAPNMASAVSVDPASSIGGALVTTAKQPKFSAQLSDPDGGSVNALLRITNTSTGGVIDEVTPYTASGGTVTKKLSASLNDGTYTAVMFAADGIQYGPVGPATTFKVDTTPPPVPTFECTGGFTSGEWYATRPFETHHCAVFSDLSAVEFIWTKNNQPQPAAKAINLQNGQTGAGLENLSVPENGVLTRSVRARDAAGNLSAPAEYGFGVGNGGTITPVDGERTSSTVLTEGEGPAGATGARIEQRPAGSDASVPWTTATKVKTGSGLFDLWLNTVTPTDRNSVTTGKLLWDIAAEPDITKPSVRETRVCFIYAGVSKCTPSRDVTIVPAAFGSSFPTQAAGPGQVALFTGEFQLSESDVEVPAYSGTLSLGRSHRSYAGTTAPAQGVFGPGWVADLEGPSAGAGSYEVTDNTAAEASITLTSPEGKSSTYVNEEYTASPQLAGYYDGDAETGTENDLLEIVDGSPKKMVLSEQDGTETTWAHVGSGKWVIEKIDEPAAAGTTTYTHDAEGLVTGIYAPTPSGVTCNATSQTAGCRALWLTYTGSSPDKRLSQIDLRIWDPKPGSDGKPGGTAAMVTVPVQKYAYNSNGTLKETWDPRIADGAAAQKTSYEYSTIGTKTVLTQATPPGQTPWRFDYGSTGSDAGKFKTVKRAQVAPLSGDATWTVVYDTALSGTGLPDVTAAATKTWGQDAAPVAAATVFGPDAPGTGDATYGTISYWDVEGRTTNTAAYGAGAWQIDSTAYDAKGNEIWALDEGNRNTALTSGGDTVATANNLSTQTVYNVQAPGIPAGTRVEETTGPSRSVILKNGNNVEGRARTITIYDDEAASESVPVPGRPTPAADAPALNLPVEERISTIAANGTVYDTKKTRFRYDPVVAGDGDGWDLKVPTRTSTQLGTGWSTQLTRSDTEGKVIETRTPEGVAAVDGTADDARSTKTVYYTADTSAADADCRSKPEWAGLECLTKTGDATVPATRTTGFDYLLNATRTEESATTTSSTMTRASITGYDTAGRKLTDKISVTGAAGGDQSVADTTFAYSATTGAPTSLTRGSVTQSTTYDNWGRVLTQTDGTGNTATATYDTAGRVKTANDGKGIYTYTYDGEDAAGKTERRGLITKLDVGLASGPSIFEVAANADGNTYLTKYPNGMKATKVFDAVGAETALTYVDPAGTQIAAFSNKLDVQSRVRLAESTGSKQTYTYDDRDRLTAVQDTTDGNCVTRKYGFSLDSNRTTVATSGPGAGGACTTTGATTGTSAFDAADRITDSGYTYDALGRTRTVPATHTDQPAGSALTVNFHANDMVAKLAQTVPNGAGGTIAKSKALTLDPSDRLSKTTDTASGVDLRKTTNHYTGAGDSPSWIETESRADASTGFSTSWSRNVTGPDGDLAIIQPSTGASKLQIANLHGDIVATIDNGTFTGFTAWVETSEYGLTKNAALTLGQNYGWLGTKQRTTDAVGALTLMGARLYLPPTGRFLSRDPVPGGNDNTYVYPVDPVNRFDLNGMFQDGGQGVTRQNGIKHTRKTSYLTPARKSAGKNAAASKARKPAKAKKAKGNISPMCGGHVGSTGYYIPRCATGPSRGSSPGRDAKCMGSIVGTAILLGTGAKGFISAGRAAKAISIGGVGFDAAYGVLDPLDAIKAGCK